MGRSIETRRPGERRSLGALSDQLRNASAWTLCGSLIYAPWDYGAVTEPAVIRLSWILAAAIAFWLCSRCLLFRNPQSAIRNFPATLLLPVAGILLLGWLSALNAKAIYDSQFFLFVPVMRWWPGLFGSVDQAVSVAYMVRVTVLLGTMLLVADLVRDPRWLLRLWWTLGLAGGSIALLGLMQKASGAPMIFWRGTAAGRSRLFSRRSIITAMRALL